MKRIAIMTAASVTLLNSSLALAESDANPILLAKPETALPGMITAIVVFALLMIVLKKAAWGPILQGLQDRETKIRTEIESAENARAQANSALDQYQKELAEARAEATQMIQQAKADAQSVADGLRSQNETELTAMKNRAKGEIDAAKRMALNEIYAETALLSTQVAGKILERELNPNDQKQLVEEALSQLGNLG